MTATAEDLARLLVALGRGVLAVLEALARLVDVVGTLALWTGGAALAVLVLAVVAAVAVAVAEWRK